MNDLRYDFDIMHCNDIIATIRFVHNNCIITPIATGFFQFFHETNQTLDVVYQFLKMRCYEDNRADLKQILDAVHLDSNNPWEWCKITHGVTWEDGYWIRQPNEQITWDEVKLR